MNIATKSIIAAGVGLLLAGVAPLAASAHVTVTPSGTAAGSYTVLTFATGHGCDGSPTTAVTFTLPDGISATPTVNPSWTIARGDGTITYTAVTPLVDDQRDTFELSVKLPEGAAGDTIAFPVLQECTVGSTDWSEIPEDGADEPEHPAPTITLSAPTGDAHGHAETKETASTNDPFARGIGIAGLVLGAAGLVLALAARRTAVKQ